jgi:hypothetical protein
MAILAVILKWLAGGVLDRVMAFLEHRMDAETERDRLTRDVVIEAVRAEIEARKAARDIVLAEQGWWVTAMVRPLFVYPLIAWWAAVIADSIFAFAWDVAALPAPLDEWSGWIVAAYFVTRPVEKMVRGYVNRG